MPVIATPCTVEAAALRGALTQVRPALPPRALERHPHLHRLHLAVQDGTLTLTAGQDTSFLAQATLAAPGPPWACSVDGIAFGKAVPRSGPVTLELASGTLTLHGAANRHYHRLAVDPACDYPAWPLLDGPQAVAILDPQVIARVWTDIVPAVSADTGRPVMESVLMTVDDTGIGFVAADGFRLHTLLGQPGGDPVPDDPAAYLVPRAAWAALARLAAGQATGVQVIRNTDRTRLEWTSGRGRVSTGLVDGTYPDWRQVIPTDGLTAWVTVDAPKLVAVLAAQAPKSRKGDTFSVRLDLDRTGLLIRSADDSDLLTDPVRLEAAAGDGASWIIVPRDYLVALLAGETTVTLSVLVPKAPLLLEAASAASTRLLMPRWNSKDVTYPGCRLLEALTPPSPPTVATRPRPRAA